MATKKYKRRIFGYIFRAICVLFIVAVLSLLLWRIIDSKTDPKELKTLTPNQILCDAYEENGKELTVFTQKQNTYSQGAKTYGYFSVTNTCFIEEAEQIQLLFRYNNSTIKYLTEDYDLPTIPSRNEDLFEVTLLVAYDLTPDDTDDNSNLEHIRFERLYPTEKIPYSKTLYNYRKLIFDGIDFGDSVLAIYVDVYYNGDVDYENETYATLIAYHYSEPTSPLKLSSADKKALEDWIKNN